MTVLRAVLAVLWVAIWSAGCAEVSRSINGAGKTFDGWFSPDR